MKVGSYFCSHLFLETSPNYGKDGGQIIAKELSNFGSLWPNFPGSSSVVQRHGCHLVGRSAREC